MQYKKRLYKPSYRKRKAYATAFRVFTSYYWLYLKSRLLGQKYYEKRINGLHARNALRIKNRFQELQGLFIKVGQLISNLSNVLPKEFRAPLQELQDHNDPRPFEEVSKTIKLQLAKEPSEIFDSISSTALATASIGQVHRAHLNGHDVVVKIQHKRIDSLAKADLQILQNLVKLHAFFMDMVGLDHTYEQVRLMIEEELNYSKEAESMELIASNLVAVPELQVKIPKIYQSHSTKKVITSSYHDGVKISEKDTLIRWGLNPEEIAKRLIELYCKMIFIDGLYHADPHPGNILVNKDGAIILLDFGAVARLSDQTKKAFSELIEAVVKNDTEQIIMSFRKMGFIGSEKASKKFVGKLIKIFQEFLAEEVEFDGMNFKNIKLNSGVSSLAGLLKKIDLREISNNIKIPKEYILLNRTIVLLLGNVFELAPELDMMKVVRPYLKKHVLDKEIGFTQMIANTVKSQLTTAISLPGNLSNFLKEAQDSDLELELQGVKKILKKIYYALNQIFYLSLFCVLFFMKSHFNGSEQSTYNTILIIFMIIIGILFLRSFYKDAKTKEI